MCCAAAALSPSWLSPTEDGGVVERDATPDVASETSGDDGCFASCSCDSVNTGVTSTSPAIVVMVLREGQVLDTSRRETLWLRQMYGRGSSSQKSCCHSNNSKYRVGTECLVRTGRKHASDLSVDAIDLDRVVLIEVDPLRHAYRYYHFSTLAHACDTPLTNIPPRHQR
jgi:hypothetical protein